MNHDDPFGSPELERTFIVPSPGRRTSRPNAPAAPEHEPVATVDDLAPEHGLNPLVAAASALLNAGPPLRTSLVHPNPAMLHETLARGIRAFEGRIARTGLTPQHALAARYMLCTFLDEMAASTPWGGSGVWSKHGLLVVFHNEAWGGEKVFQLLAKLAENPAGNRDLLELMYVILSLGFEGRYRVLDNGRSQLDQLRSRLYTMIQTQRGPFEADLSPNWRGVTVDRPAFLHLPMWAVLSLMVVIALFLLVGLRARLVNQSDPVSNRISALRARPIPPEARPDPAPAPAPRLAQLLAPDVRGGKVKVADFADRSVVTIRGDGLFESGGTIVSESVRPVIDDIAKALATLPGAVEILGYTDDRPIRSLRFGSNYELSKERAATVREQLARSVDPSRLKADGRAERDPIATNATPEGRAQNRRVEITLFASRGT